MPEDIRVIQSAFGLKDGFEGVEKSEFKVIVCVFGLRERQ